MLYAPPELVGTELEVSRIGTAARAHVTVLARDVAGRAAPAAVYPALVAGDYVLWRPDGEPALTVRVTGGEVAVAHWPAG